MLNGTNDGKEASASLSPIASDRVTWVAGNEPHAGIVIGASPEYFDYVWVESRLHLAARSGRPVSAHPTAEAGMAQGAAPVRPRPQPEDPLVMPPWLSAVLLAHASKCLDTETEREQLAAAILEALPRHMMAEVIRGSATAVLGMRDVVDPDGAIARELGNNAAGSLVLALTVGEEHLS